MTQENHLNVIEDEKKNSVLDEVFEWLESIAFSLFIVILLFTFLFRTVDVIGSSMSPTLTGKDRYNSSTQGDKLIISHIFYQPKQGDIIAVKSEALNENIIKRIIAIENQEIKIDFSTGKVFVDGEQLFENYILDTIAIDESRGIFSAVVPKNCVFVMGDNRNNSLDSRDSRISFIKESDILGKAVFRVFPFKSFGGLY